LGYKFVATAGVHCTLQGPFTITRIKKPEDKIRLARSEQML